MAHFEPIVEMLLVEFSEMFSRFTRSSEFHSFVESKSRQDMLRFVSVKYVDSNYTIEVPVSFHDTIRKIDIEFALSQAEDSVLWEMIAQDDITNGGATFISRNRFKLGDTLKPSYSKGFKLMKSTGILPFHYKDVMCAVIHEQGKQLLDNSLVNVQHLGFIHRNQRKANPYCVTVTSETFPLIFPFQNRDFLMHSTVIHQETAKRFIVISKSSEPDLNSKQGNGAIVIFFPTLPLIGSIRSKRRV